MSLLHYFFFNDTATTEIYTLSLHDALPICPRTEQYPHHHPGLCRSVAAPAPERPDPGAAPEVDRSEEHTSELQSRQYLVCRLLLEKKNRQRHHVGDGHAGAQHRSLARGQSA